MILILILIPIRQARHSLRFGSGRAIQGTSSVASLDQSANQHSRKAPGIRQFQLGLCTEPIDRQGSSLSLCHGAPWQMVRSRQSA